MIPCVNDSNFHTLLGSRQERLRERKAIHEIERQELGLHIESAKALLDRQQKQSESANRLAVPFPRRVVERKAKHDLLDIRLAQRARQGPLPVDEEVAEENEILQKQIQRLRQTGVHLLQGGGNATLNSSAGFFGQGQQQHGGMMIMNNNNNNNNFENNNNNNTSSFFLTGVVAENNNINTSQQHPRPGSHAEKNAYAGDVLFRPGRVTQNLEPSEFWLYARQKVTQRTLGTTILQHPVVVGQGTDAESLKQLLLQSPIATVIRRKIANLLAQTVNRTRCGILFDLLSTKNIIVSGVPNVVGQIIYEHIADTIGVEHAAMKFAFVGITDNSNCCAARDVFCQTKSLQGKNISGTKRGFDALDNVHTFAVVPPGGFETLLGPAALANEQLQQQLEDAKTRRPGSPNSSHRSPSSKSRKNKKGRFDDDDDDDYRKKRNQSSPLGMRPWHAAMKKTKPQYSALLVDQQNHQSGNDSPFDNLSHIRNFDDSEGKGDASLRRNNNKNRRDDSSLMDFDDDDDLYDHDDDHHVIKPTGKISSEEERRLAKRHKQQLKELRDIEESLSPLPMMTKDDMLAAFDSRDLKFLPHAFLQARKNTRKMFGTSSNNIQQEKTLSVTGTTGKKITVQEKIWQESEMKHMNELLLGPTVKLGKMTKRYNTQTPSAAMKKYRMALTPTPFTENKRPASSEQFERKTFSVGPGRFGN